MMRSRFIQSLLRNWKMKLGSFAASIILYGYIQYTSNIKRILHVKVVKPELAEGLMYASPIPPFLNIEMSGSEEINNFESHEFKIHLRLSNPPYQPGKENLFRAMISPEFPKDINIEYENKIYVLLDRVMERELPVLPQIQAALAKGQTLGYVKVEPPTIKLIGPEQVLRDMEQVGTKSVEMLNESIIHKKIQIHGLPEFVSLAKGEGDLVKVSAIVLPEKIENTKMIEGIPLKCSNEIAGLQLQVLGSDTIKVLIKSNEVDITAEDFVAEVFCPVYYDELAKQIQPGFHIKNKPVMLKDLKNRLNIHILKIIPSMVSMQFEKIKNPQQPKDTRQQGFQEHILIQP